MAGPVIGKWRGRPPKGGEIHPRLLAALVTALIERPGPAITPLQRVPEP
jgi:hypothetical protein